MQENQIKLVNIIKEIESFKKEIKARNAELGLLLKEVGIDSMFQDPSDKVVYQIIQPKGRFVDFPEIGYERTKRDDESKGSLSKKKAIEAGFSL